MNDTSLMCQVHCRSDDLSFLAFGMHLDLSSHLLSSHLFSYQPFFNANSYVGSILGSLADSVSRRSVPQATYLSAIPPPPGQRQPGGGRTVRQTMINVLNSVVS